LSFLASLFTADLSGITDGSIKCPVVVIASKGDPLFSFSYCSTVFEKIAAPKKEMLVFDEPCHLILNECVDKVIEPIVEGLRRYSGK
jgi:esterase/lipase